MATSTDKTKKPPAEDTPNNEASGAAVAEVEAETQPEAVIEFEFLGDNYSFKAKRLRAMQFLGPMQADRDIEAIEWLMGPAQYQRFLRKAADEDGCTDRTQFLELLREIGKAQGVPNS